ncbi:uncharacterized protein LACBIDRAFT_308008 [Laccaria bicolor S238N-H82]|uniref:Predicted protein n=1 Tax=Laccaria bicolor (strain S238N-H82 / ATCC MYA-4686) TaxID=486041 RepID=B0DRE6_LACBS|nr:uncharacterized protein LACBIDRAFT_308008 [Laccaria bicolor S238N-H82]EDR02857.1 predicted protein [Laccaria bicolor S238N-H82]|eukprot:XP_001886567.1 predicted protein [Laccaria bicolor S238N-H82]
MGIEPSSAFAVCNYGDCYIRFKQNIKIFCDVDSPGHFGSYMLQSMVAEHLNLT